MLILPKVAALLNVHEFFIISNASFFV